MLIAAPTVVDALVHADETAAWVAGLPPQSVDVAVLGALTASSLSQHARIDAVVAIDRQIAMLTARSVELHAAIAADSAASTNPREEFTRDALAMALRVPPASMPAQLRRARRLTEQLPATLGLLRTGAISHRHALAALDVTEPLTPEQTAQVEAQALGRAGEQTVTQFRAAVRKAAARVADPGMQERAHRAAVADRRVEIRPDENGMSTLWALLPTPDVAAIGTVLDAIAHATVHGKGGDPRTADQRRADALVQLASTALASEALSGGHGRKPAVVVTIAASTLARLDEQPGEIDGYGPITAAMARRIAADDVAEWTLALTDNDGQVLAVGKQTYRPTADMIRHVLARDRHCTFPGCRRPAGNCDLDHRDPWQPGDLTSIANLHALCRRHHRAKHTGRWKITRNQTTGVTTWTDRHGRTYTSRPPDRPTTTPADNTAKTTPPAEPPDDPPF